MACYVPVFVNEFESLSEVMQLNGLSIDVCHSPDSHCLCYCVCLCVLHATGVRDIGREFVVP